MNGEWTASDFEALAPGPRAGVVLASVVPGRLSGAVLVAWLAAQARQVAHDEARLMAGLVAVVDALDRPRFVDPPGPVYRGREEPRDLAADEISAALAITKLTAGSRIDLAQACVRRLPDLHEAMLAGRVDYPKVMLFVKATGCLSETKARAVVDSLLDKAAGRSTAQLGPMLARRVARADPDAAQRRHKKARADRQVALYPQADGTATLTARGLPALRAQQAFGRVHAIATTIKHNGDGRLLDQSRTDVLLDLLQGLPVPGPDGQDTQPAPATTGAGVELTVPLTTLLGLADEPGQFGTWGPLLADAAKTAIAQLRDAPWRLSITHPDTGQVIAHTALRRRPTAADLAYVRARDRTCRFRGCRRPAIACEIDHSTAWSEGGPTRTANLGPSATATTASKPDASGA